MFCVHIYIYIYKYINKQITCGHAACTSVRIRSFGSFQKTILIMFMATYQTHETLHALSLSAVAPEVSVHEESPLLHCFSIQKNRT